MSAASSKSTDPPECAGTDAERGALIETARAWVAAGFRVVITDQVKAPRQRIKHLLDGAPCDFDFVVRRLHEVPEPGLAVVCGLAGGVDVLDVEVEGLWALEGLELPSTPTSRSQSGGLHFYFRAGQLRLTTWTVDGSRLGDIRGRGGLVTIPPSRGLNGEYSWLPGLAPWEVAFADPPRWLVEYVWSGRDTGWENGGRRNAAITFSQPPVSPPHNGEDRSRSDQALALELFCERLPFDGIVATIASTPAAQDRWNPDDYALRTARKAVEYAFHHVPTCALQSAWPTANGIRAIFRVEHGEHAGHILTLDLDWPVTRRSAKRWHYIGKALGIGHASPQHLPPGVRLALEIRPQGNRLRIRRIFPPRLSRG